MTNKDWKVRFEESEQARRALIAALRTYGQHKNTCESQRRYRREESVENWQQANFKPCSCGLADLLADHGENAVAKVLENTDGKEVK